MFHPPSSSCDARLYYEELADNQIKVFVQSSNWFMHTARTSWAGNFENNAALMKEEIMERLKGYGPEFAHLHSGGQEIESTMVGGSWKTSGKDATTAKDGPLAAGNFYEIEFTIQKSNGCETKAPMGKLQRYFKEFFPSIEVQEGGDGYAKNK